MSRARPLPFKCSRDIDVECTIGIRREILTSRAVSARDELRAKGIVFSITSARPHAVANLLGPSASHPMMVSRRCDCKPGFGIIHRHLLSPDVARTRSEMLEAREVRMGVQWQDG